MNMNTVTLIAEPGGMYHCTPEELDVQIERHLPTSVNALRALVEDRTGLDYAHVHDVTTFLVMLADFEPTILDDAPPARRCVVIKCMVCGGGFTPNDPQEHATRTGHQADAVAQRFAGSPR
jgi:hypothetical protein